MITMESSWAHIRCIPTQNKKARFFSRDFQIATILHVYTGRKKRDYESRLFLSVRIIKAEKDLSVFDI